MLQPFLGDCLAREIGADPRLPDTANIGMRRIEHPHRDEHVDVVEDLGILAAGKAMMDRQSAIMPWLAR